MPFTSGFDGLPSAAIASRALGALMALEYDNFKKKDNTPRFQYPHDDTH